MFYKSRCYHKSVLILVLYSSSISTEMDAKSSASLNTCVGRISLEEIRRNLLGENESVMLVEVL